MPEKFAFFPTHLAGMHVVRSQRFQDDRGYFSETYGFEAFKKAGVDTVFVQDNQSRSIAAGTLRGLHYQRAPYAQAKLVRVLRGRIWDVGVDIRRGSSTFGQWFGLELSAENDTQLFIPEGFAHGFVTLEPDCEVAYKVSATYSGEHDAGLAWDDPTLAIGWPYPYPLVSMSEKDRNQPSFVSAQPFD